MSKKKSFIIRINEDLLNTYEKWATDELRSTNAQIEYILLQSALKTKRYKMKKPE